MRRWAVGAAGVGAVLALLWVLAGPSGPEVEVSREEPVATSVPVATRSAVAVPEVAASPAPGGSPDRSLQPYDDVVEACGFDVEERCLASGCGAVVAMPDLDRLDGWLRLAFEQPGVVGSTAARDLGLPVAWTSCGDALVASPEVMSAQVGWNRELWCVGDRAACDVAARERHGWEGFSGGVRLTRRVFVLD